VLWHVAHYYCASFGKLSDRTSDQRAAAMARVRAAERAQKAYERDLRTATRDRIAVGKESDRQQKTEEKQRAAEYLQSRLDEAEELNQEIAKRLQAMHSLLEATLAVDDYFDLDSLKDPFNEPAFEPGNLVRPEPPLATPAPVPTPSLDSFLPVAPSGLAARIPGAHKKHEQRVATAQDTFEKALEDHAATEAARAREHADLMEAHGERERQREAQLATARIIHSKAVEDHGWRSCRSRNNSSLNLSYLRTIECPSFLRPVPIRSTHL
jgi:restriction system protein